MKDNSNSLIRFAINNCLMNYSEAIELSQQIQFKLNEMRCSNPDCDRYEKRAGRMCEATVIGTPPVSLPEELTFTDMICCDVFKAELQERYSQLVEELG